MNTVLRIIVIAILAVTLAVPAAAIDKTTKKNKPPKPPVVSDSSQPKNSYDSNQNDTVQNPDEGKKGYDDFIDANGNGIDDRAEKKNPSPQPKKK